MAKLVFLSDYFGSVYLRLVIESPVRRFQLLLGGLLVRRRRDLADPVAALAAKPLFGFLLRQPRAGAARLAARWADQQHVRQLDWHLLREPTTLQIALAAAHVLVNAV